MGEQRTAEQIARLLAEPFHASEIEWRIGSTNQDKTRGMALAYVDNRAIQRRLDAVMGIDGWRNEFREWQGKGALCGLSLRFGGEWITKWDGADNTDFEATKGGLSDAMKRAAYQWGIGRYLYDLPSQWVETEVYGKTVVIKKGHAPSLPAWALPGDTANQGGDGGAGAGRTSGATAGTPFSGIPTAQEESGRAEPPAQQQRLAPPAPPQQGDQAGQRRQNPESAITEGQRKRLYAISKEHEWPKAEAKALLERWGYQSSEEVKVKDYDAIIAALEEGPPVEDPFAGQQTA